MTARALVGFVSAFVAATAIGASSVYLRKASDRQPNDSGISNDSAPLSGFRSERSIVLVYVGRMSCSWCRHPDTANLLEKARSRLQFVADSLEAQLRVYGIGVDRDVEASLTHLKKLGHFDNVSAGDAWGSLAGGLLVRGALAGPRATPQLLVLIRESLAAGTEKAGFSETVSELLLVRKVGLQEIHDWIAAGAPLPTLKGGSVVNDKQ